MFYNVFLLVHVLIALGLVSLVLLQQGRGAEAGAAFGGGASGTVFGAQGSASFLSRVTAGLATGFFLTSLVLGYFATQAIAPSSVLERVGEEQTVVVDDDSETSGNADVPDVPSIDDDAPAPATEEAETQTTVTDDVDDVPSLPGTETAEESTEDTAPADDVPAAPADTVVEEE